MNTLFASPTVRLAGSNDAGMFLAFLRRLDAESQYMHFAAGERTMTEQGMRSRFRKMDRQGNSFIVLALGVDDTPIGYFSVNGGTSMSTKHSASVAVGVSKSYRRQGVAVQLLRAALAYSVDRGVVRWECTVVSYNEPARCFYFANDFRHVGTLHKRFYDALIGAKADELVFERLFY